MAGDLIIPRCEVYWGDENLTFFEPSAKWPNSDGPQPLVYNVRVSLHDEGQTPSGSMEWNPTGPAFEEYRRLVTTKKDQTIVVRFYYYGGPSVAFSFVWAGQEEAYGNKMGITVKLRSELDGLCNSFIKHFAQTPTITIEGNPVGTEISVLAAMWNLMVIYGLVESSPIEAKYKDELSLLYADRSVYLEIEKIKVQSNYSEGTTFTQSLENLLGQTGHLVTYTNFAEGYYSRTNQIILSRPYVLYDKEIKNGKLVPSLNKTKVLIPGQGDDFSAGHRYLYFLLPSLIGDISKVSEWTPRQLTTQGSKGIRQKVEKLFFTQTEAGIFIDLGATQKAAQDAIDRANQQPGAMGSYGSLSSPGMRLKNNENGEIRKRLLQQERVATLTTNIFMAPSYVGIKPLDILIIPDLSENSEDRSNWEDWIVNSVEYSQNEEGGIFISIQASRVYGLGNLMAYPDVVQNGEVIEDFFTSKEKRISSLDNYISYGWDTFISSSASNKPLTGALPKSSQPPNKPQEKITSEKPSTPSLSAPTQPVKKSQTSSQRQSFNERPTSSSGAAPFPSKYPGSASLFKASVHPVEGGVRVSDLSIFEYLTKYPQYTHPKMGGRIFGISLEKARIYLERYLDGLPITY